ncbi:MAG: hypothetical protein A2Y62_09165 [Candidatus Fischerbacteria bacterium RBG_13_37_8]|uniref:Uncharacterized protein n=1 Tax=Candidatus Fischerbacteria bacterium RBG_13_37_8 TaxID=1817863 RepID=A0A1F5VK30_9BACT|nr:MAG: hypothetical protein A2Y62_09165 [Candidatus Fischerbacteria bacterium RBG_13_37_8]
MVTFSDKLDAEEQQKRARWWLLHGGFGGLIGSVNVPLEYFVYLENISERDRCVFILKDKFDRQDYYYTEIDREYIFFKNQT